MGERTSAEERNPNQEYGLELARKRLVQGSEEECLKRRILFPETAYYDNPLYGIWFGEVTGLKKPYQQWVAAAAVPAICFRGLPVMKYGYLARSNTSVEKNIAVLGLEGLPADAKLKLVEGLRRRARHWAFATIFAVSFALKKRDEAVRDNIKKKEYEDICKKGKYEQ